MQELKQQLPFTLLMLLILLVGSFFLFSESMDLYPAYVHSWTQSDRLAIAMKFQENGFDFFHPATYNLLTKDGITQVDFPIHDYLVAIISKISGFNIISTFRYYNLIYVLIGFFFFYRSALLMSGSALRSILITSSILSLPFFAYYQNGFLPSVPSYANFCIGLYLWLRFQSDRKTSSFYWSIFFLTLAALARTPFAIGLLSIGVAQLSMDLKNGLSLKRLLAVSLGITLLISYYLYNQSLADQYGSMFLGKLRNPKDLDEFVSIFSGAFERWKGQIFTPFHLSLYLILVILGIKQRPWKSNKGLKALSQILVVYFIGAFCYFLMMGMQFIDHDYYYIDSLLPLLSTAILWLFANLKIEKRWYVAAVSLSVILMFGFYSGAKEVIDLRYSKDYNGRSLYTYEVFEGAVNDLTEWGVEKTDTLAFLDIGSTNIPFTLYGNNGYTSLSSGKKSTDSILDRSFQYAFILDSFKISDSYLDYPEIAQKLSFVNSNGSISMYRKNNGQNASEFFRELYYQYDNSFENKIQDSITTISAFRSKEEMSNNHFLNIDGSFEYILTSRIDLSKVSKEDDLKIAIKFDIHAEDSVQNLQLIFSAGDYYFSNFLESDVLIQTEETIELEWQGLQFLQTIPSYYLNSGKELVVYFWNPKEKLVKVDNYHLIIYQ